MRLRRRKGTEEDLEEESWGSKHERWSGEIRCTLPSRVDCLC